MESAEFMQPHPTEIPIQTDVDPAEKAGINNAFYDGFKKVYEVNPELLPTNPALIVALDDSDLKLKGKKLNDDTVKETAGDRQKAREQKLTRKSVLEDKEDIRNMPESTAEEKTAKDNAVADERRRRKELMGAADTIYTATTCEAAIKKDVVDRVVLAENKKRVGLTPDEEEKFRADYIAQYTDGKGTYYKLDPVTGKPDKTKPVSMARVYQPIYDEIKRIGADTNNVLQYDETHNVFLGTSAEEVRKKELKETSTELMEVVTDVFDTALMPYGEAIPKKKNEKTKKEEIDFEALEKVFPSGRFGRMAMLFTTYHELDPVKNAEQRNTCAALLLQELRGVKIEPESDLGKRINSLSANGEILDAQLGGLTAAMKGLIADVLKKKPEEIQVDERYIVRDLLIAYACKAHVGLDAEGNIAFDQEAKKLIGKFIGEDRIYKTEEAYLAALSVSGEKIGTLLIDASGIDSQRLQKPLEEGASYYAKQLVTSIRERRKELKEKDPSIPELTPHQEGNYQHVSEEMIKYEALKFIEKNPLANWLKMLGMLALILGPGFSKILDIGTESGGGEQQQG